MSVDDEMWIPFSTESMARHALSRGRGWPDITFAGADGPMQDTVEVARVGLRVRMTLGRHEPGEPEQGDGPRADEGWSRKDVRAYLRRFKAPDNITVEQGRKPGGDRRARTWWLTSDEESSRWWVSSYGTAVPGWEEERVAWAAGWTRFHEELMLPASSRQRRTTCTGILRT